VVHGSYSGRDYELRRCEHCRFAFVADPWTDFARIYDERYYGGRGADPLVDYEFELEHPARTIRRYEWRGITEIVNRLLGGLDGVNWLDFGCGNGGLVRYVSDNTAATAVGYEDGAIAARARDRGIPIMAFDELQAKQAQFDVVTAIEVLEHTLDPIAELRRMRALLRDGGLLFLTTGNAAPFADRLARWSYVTPEIHISFFEPKTLEFALSQAGFAPAPSPAAGGWNEILKFKVLKNLRMQRRTLLTDLLPAAPIAAIADRHVRLRDHPIGWAT
jgi:SAM-dependent methyltransferase